MKSSNKLTAQQKAFAQAYIKGATAKDAALSAGYSPKSASQAATHTLKNPLVRSMITRAQNHTEREAKFSFNWKLNKLGKVVDSGIPDNTEEEPLLVDVPVAAALTAITIMNKMQGHEAAEKHVNVNLEAEADKEILEELIKKNEKDY